MGYVGEVGGGEGDALEGVGGGEEDVLLAAAGVVEGDVGDFVIAPVGEVGGGGEGFEGDVLAEGVVVAGGGEGGLLLRHVVEELRDGGGGGRGVERAEAGLGLGGGEEEGEGEESGHGVSLLGQDRPCPTRTAILRGWRSCADGESFLCG